VSPGKILSIRVKLRNFSPPIWRRIEVPYNFTLHQLHLTIQAAMGWDNYHLYAFRIGRTSYSIPSDEYPNDDIDSRKTGITDLVFMGQKPKMIYEYDFGDGWEHDVTIQKTLNPEQEVEYPRCVSGKMACPPEDCGGVYGYVKLLEILNDPMHEEYKDMLEWVGGKFDPERFDLEEANERVSNYEKMEM
jgi:hypothetical protein